MFQWCQQYFSKADSKWKQTFSLVFKCDPNSLSHMVMSVTSLSPRKNYTIGDRTVKTPQGKTRQLSFRTREFCYRKELWYWNFALLNPPQASVVQGLETRRDGRGWCYPPFVQLGPSTRFSKVPTLFGRISGDIVVSVSSKPRCLKARNFAFILIFIP